MRARRRGRSEPCCGARGCTPPTWWCGVGPAGGESWPRYNTEHRHSALGLMTPHDIHYGLAEGKWQQRAQVLRAAYAAHPERFPRGVPVPPPLPTAAWINKPPAVPTLATPEGTGS